MKKLLFIVPFFFFLIPRIALGAGIVEDSNNNVASFSFSNGEYVILWNHNKTQKMIVSMYSDSNFTSVEGTYTHIASEQGYDYHAGIRVACFRYMKVDLYNGSNSHLGYVKVNTYGGECGENNSSIDYTNILNQIKTSLGNNGKVLSDILDELQKTITSPNYPKVVAPSHSKPNQPNESFQDNKKYFEDKGDGQKVPKLPDAPEPMECWDVEGLEVCREDELTAEDELKQDDELTVDPIPKKDDELTVDPIPKQDDELIADPEPVKDKELIPDIRLCADCVARYDEEGAARVR